jgi:ribosomal protein S27E
MGSKKYIKALFKFILYYVISISILIFLLSFFPETDGGKYFDYTIQIILFLFGLGFLTVIISDTEFFNRVFNRKNYFITYCICPHCLNNVNLWTEANEEWQCNYCGKSFSGNILRDCPSCGFFQRLFECSFCEKLIDIDAEHDMKKLVEMQNERQTIILQQKNQVKQSTDTTE